MIDFHTLFYNALNSILPTHYEMVLKSGTPIPCISYMEIGNAAEEIGDTVGYSRPRFQVKVWSNNIAEIQKYALMIDDVLRPMGWKRISSNEMYDNNSSMIQKIMVYEKLARESFN